MPATKRKSNSLGRSQPPLSFNNSSAKITKPSIGGASTSSKSHKLIKEEHSDSVSIPSPGPDEVDSQIEDVPTTTELAIRQQVEEEKKVKSEQEIRAEAVSDAQIKRYWKAKEAERKAPRG
jgi:DNA polymerase delta subunit 4